MGEEDLSIPLLELFMCQCSLVWSHKVHVVGTALSSTSVIGMLAVDPGISQTLFSSGHQHRCVEIRSQDYSSCASGPTVGAMEATDTDLAQPPNMYSSTKPKVPMVRLPQLPKHTPSVWMFCGC